MYARNHRHEKGIDMSENPSEKDVTSNPFMGAAPARELDVPEPASRGLQTARRSTMRPRPRTWMW